MALRAREMTGEGQFIDIGLYEPIFRFLDELPGAYHKNGFIRQRMGPAMKNAVPHSHYPTKEGRWIAIACTSDKIFERLAGLIGRPEVAGDGIFGTYPQRDERREEVDRMVTDWTSGLTRDEALQRCAEAQVPCGMVAAIDEIFEDAQYQARENIVLFDDPRAGEVAVQNVVPRMSGTPGAIESLGPAVGAHNQEIYGGLLGMSDAQVQDLAAKKVI